MSEEKSKDYQAQFVAEWSALNLIGLIIGLFFVSILAPKLESFRDLAWKYGLASYFQQSGPADTLFVWFPLGISLGLLQWVKLRSFKINLLSWILVTAIGCGVLVLLFTWIDNISSSFDYWMKYHVPSWVINIGLIVAMTIGGAFLGGLQALVLRKRISNVGLWIRAYSLGLFPPTILVVLISVARSIFLDLTNALMALYVFGMLSWLLNGFLIIVTALGIGIPTGKLLLQQSNMNFDPREAG